MKAPKTPMVEVRVHTQCKNSSPFFVRIAHPKKKPQSGDFFCRVTSSASIAFRLDVYGVDALQAIRLALQISAARIASILSDELIDASGESEPDT